MDSTFSFTFHPSQSLTLTNEKWKKKVWTFFCLVFLPSRLHHHSEWKTWRKTACICTFLSQLIPFAHSSARAYKFCIVVPWDVHHEREKREIHSRKAFLCNVERMNKETPFFSLLHDIFSILCCLPWNDTTKRCENVGKKSQAASEAREKYNDVMNISYDLSLAALWKLVIAKEAIVSSFFSLLHLHATEKRSKRNAKGLKCEQEKVNNKI